MAGSKLAKRSELSEREQHLLKALVERYIQDGDPVGSRMLAREAGLSLSPATIRNVMADLEELGLIVAPHTSAGRIPTVSGYRLFIDSLLTVKPLERSLIEQMHGLMEKNLTHEELLEATSKMLSGFSRMAGLVTVPRREQVIMRHIEFLPLSQGRVLAILVTKEMDVHNRILQPARPFSPSELQEAANYLNSNFQGKELSAIRERMQADLESTRNDMQVERQRMVEMAELALRQEESRDSVVVSGEVNLMSFNEFAGTERLRSLFETLHEKEDILHLLDRCLETNGVQIFIGDESGYSALEPCSVVTASYTSGDRVLGVLGVIGPTRMAYERVIPLVDVTAKLLSVALNQRAAPP